MEWYFWLCVVNLVAGCLGLGVLLRDVAIGMARYRTQPTDVAADRERRNA